MLFHQIQRMAFLQGVSTFACGCWKVTLELLARAEYLNRLVGVAGNLCKLPVWLCRTDEKQICTVSFRAFSCDSCNKLSETTHEINGQMFITLSSYPFVLKAFICSFAPRALSKLQNPWPNKIIEFILKVYILKDSRREKQ